VRRSFGSFCGFGIHGNTLAYPQTGNESVKG
jgi:hypothetical protein